MNKRVSVYFQTSLVVQNVVIGADFWTKLSGYMFRAKPHVPGILFESATAIQTTFMFFDLDLVFLTADNQVVKVVRGLKPWRQTWFYLKAKRVLEVPAGTIPMTLKEGDQLDIRPA